MDIHTRIRQLRQDRGLSMEDVANAIGVSWQTVQQWEKEGGTAPKRMRLQAVADFFKVTTLYLLYGNDNTNSEFSYINEIDLKLSAGTGNIVILHDVDKQIAFRTTFLKKEGVKPENALSFRVSGDSVSDCHILDGSMVVINTAKKQPVEDKLFAIWIDDSYYIKKLVKVGDMWFARSCNAEKKNQYPDIPINKEMSGIIGRVFYCGFVL